MMFSSRDKYLSQLQLMYTEKLAKKGCVKGGVVQKMGEDMIEDEIEKAEIAEREKKFANQLLVRKKQDCRYGPAYERVVVLDSERYNAGEDVDFLEGCYRKTKSAAQNTSEVVTNVDQETSAKNVKHCYVNDYMKADTMNDFLRVSELEKLASGEESEKPQHYVHRDTTLSKAAHDVKDRVKNAGKEFLPQKQSIKDMNFNYRGKQNENIGNFERAFVRSTMYKNQALPDFDVGYDVV